MFTIALRLPPETRFKLELLARLSGRTRSFLVSEAVRRFVDAELAEYSAAAQEQCARTGPSNERETQDGWNIVV